MSNIRWARALFLLGSFLTIGFASQINRAYQDVWVLQDLWFPLIVLSALYVVLLVEADIKMAALLSMVFVFTLYAVPSTKYMFPYGSTSDVASHTSLTRAIASTGYVSAASVYRYTPGFHALAALLGQLSGGERLLGLRLLPAVLASLVPAGAYMLSRRLEFPGIFAKLTVVLSGLALPQLFLLNGTSFTIPLFQSLLIILLLKEASKNADNLALSYTAVSLILVATIVTWHPASSLLIPGVFVGSGIIRRTFGWFKQPSWLQSVARVEQFGLLGAVAVISYWMYDAGLVWDKFVLNVSSALNPGETPALVPSRLYELPILDQIIVGLFYHARDGVVVVMAGAALLLLLRDRGEARFRNALRILALIWALWCALLLVVFLTGFGAQGYRRFLSYVIGAAPVLAAYAGWKMVAFGRRRLQFARKPMFGLCLAALVLATGLELFPYQPAVPDISTAPGNVAPAIWLHQVNTIYQQKMLQFADSQLPAEGQLLTDYVGSRQSILFIGPDARTQRRTGQQRSEAAFLLLHWPGKAGAYGEQAEYRSPQVIERWRNMQMMDTIYDNGGSFILFHPRNGVVPFRLEAESS